jgi:hypothetical protein
MFVVMDADVECPLPRDFDLLRDVVAPVGEDGGCSSHALLVRFLVAAGCGLAYFLLDFAAICICKSLTCLNTLSVPFISKAVTHPVPLVDQSPPLLR